MTNPILELNDHHRKALEGAVEAGLAGSLAEALDAAIAQYCEQLPKPAPEPKKQPDQRVAEVIDGKPLSVDSIEEMDAFVKQQIAERSQALVEKLAALREQSGG